MKLKIVSDGTCRGTYVETEFGDRIENVERIDFAVSREHFATVADVRLRFTRLESEIDAGCVICKCDPSGRPPVCCTRRIEETLDELYPERKQRRMKGPDSKDGR
jgi:uncharacterized hydantoinase/oxoprolinase family protein